VPPNDYPPGRRGTEETRGLISFPSFSLSLGGGSGGGGGRDEGVGSDAGPRLRLRPRAHGGRHARALRHPAARQDRRRPRVQEHPRRQ
jgi:hypothetical protein